MAAKTTAASGLWSATGTWTGGVVPVAGDTVTLNHVVTVDDTRIVGVSPVAGAATAAILCNAALTIAATGNLTVRGDIGLNNVPLNMAGGAVLEFDAHLAGTPSTARYRCVPKNATDPAAILTVTGTSGAHATIRSNAGGANGRFVNNGNDSSGLVNATYCDFLRIGDASNPALDPIMADGNVFSLVNCTFDTCGSIGNAAGVGAYGSQAQITLDHVRMTNSLAESYELVSAARTGTGIRRLVFCDFDSGMRLLQCGGYTIEDCVLRSWDVSGSVAWESFKRNLHVAADGTNDMVIMGEAVDCYVARVGNQTNPHCFAVLDTTTRITGCIFDAADGTDGSGDCVTLGAPGTPITVTIDHCLVLRANGTDENTGTMSSCLGNANVTVLLEHNTYHGGQGAYFGEGYAGHASMGTVRYCLAFAGTGAFIVSGDPGATANVVPGSAAHHNGVHNPGATNGYDTDLTFSPATQGAGDVNGDPQFLDYNRNIKTWDTSLGGPGTIANAAAEIGLGNRTIGALLAYVRAGYRPSNPVFYAATDKVAPSNGWIGAVEGPTPYAPAMSRFPKPTMRGVFRR